MLLQFAVSAPSGWIASTVPHAELKAGDTQSFPLSVRPPAGIAAGTYEIRVAAVNTQLKVAAAAAAKYIISAANAAALTITPPSFRGTPEQHGIFSIVVTDNNPSTFPSSLYLLDMKTPPGWASRLSAKQLLIRASESRNATLEIVPNATPDDGVHQVEVKLTQSNKTTSAFIPYTITLCGDGICQVGEEAAGGACAADCPLTAIKCAGRCETETDWGVGFKGNIDTLTTRFIVCRQGSSPSECEQAFNANSCGFGRACICGSSLGTDCEARCVDLKGAYYMVAKSVGATLRSANYSYACPFVNLEEIIELRDDFIKARIEYEKSHSALQETIGRTANITERAKYQPCSQGLELITDNITDFVRLLNGVIEFPGKSNTTQARTKANDMKLFIENTFATYCKTTLGILKIENIEPPGQTEVGRKATARVDIKNIGSVNYYGYAECDFVNPAGRPEREKSGCTLVPQGASNSFQLSHDINASGNWRLKCRLIGSLKSDCSSEVHDESSLLAFNAYTKEVFVQDVVATPSGSAILCSVRTNRAAQCVGCRVGAAECRKVRQNNETTLFECLPAAGDVKITGYVFPTADCVPVEPKNKTVVERLAGCGDGVKEGAEECEPPGQLNSACSQESFRCDEVTKKYGFRSETGLCSAQCRCVASEQFSYSCVADKCGATCSDGDERPADEEGCVLRCGTGCDWVKDCSNKQSFFFDPEKATGTSKAGAPVDYTAVIKNTGPEEDSYAFVTDTGRVFIDEKESYEVTLASGAQKRIVVNVVPQTRNEGERELSTIIIQSEKNGKRTAEYMTVISSVPNSPPYMSNIAHEPASAKIGEMITFFADITDPEGDSIASASVCGDPDCGKTYCALFLTGASGTCIYIAERGGEQQYYIVARDEHGLSVSSARTFFVEKPIPLGVEGNETITKTESTEGSTIFSLVLVAFMVVLAGLAYHFRDGVRERMSRFKLWLQYRFSS
ncbi:MAG: hypothetical protein HY368_00825 [Candidatus Aenigmarchaeota archaeon]|nr:hypothetical protein [Candidatus Aenigmarchaeota archaeon]